MDRLEGTDDHAFVFVGPLAAVVLPERDGRAARALEEIRARAGGAPPSDRATPP
ncbi:hypothetical protein [Puerhibacterium sp. TATVAM-FAB25]|uniref:hypothetical protein n=1 Tax=Puerhibacterium sp. TATVAM-FAB25 TaxID=3093699 RepID=UPI00397AFE12